MLGSRRAYSVFQEEDIEQKVALNQLSLGADQAEDVRDPLPAPEVNKRMEELMNTSAKTKHAKELGTENRTHSLFFAPEAEKKDFQTVLKEVQEYISSNYSSLITNQDLEDAKEQMKRYIGKYVMDERIAVKGLEEQALIDALYTEMAEYGFLTKYIFGKGIEEIDSATRS